MIINSSKPISVLTCAGFDEYKAQDEALIQSLSHLGFSAESVVWNQPKRDWSCYRAVVVSSTWDYSVNPQQNDRFLTTLKAINAGGIHLFNPLKTIEWNCRKTYLKEVQARGIPIIETIWLAKDHLRNLPSLLDSKKLSDVVIKPVLSSGALYTRRFSIGQIKEVIHECEHRDVAEWMIQPFASEIIEDGEYSFIYLSKEFSHCVLKKPVEGCFLAGRNHTSNNVLVDPSGEMLKQAQKIIDMFAQDNLTTRLDIIRRGPDLVVMEIEMIEPYLYAHLASDFSDKHAAALIEKLQ